MWCLQLSEQVQRINARLEAALSGKPEPVGPSTVSPMHALGQSA